MTIRPITAETQNEFFDTAFADQPIMGVFRGLDPKTAVDRANLAWDAGVNNVEIPVESAAAMPTLKAVISAGNERGKLVGAGTIITVDQLIEVADIGAAYSVSPGFSRNVALTSLARGLPHLPGVATASEILAARSLGLTWCKAFPGSVLGSKWITAMLGPFPEVKFAVTGGMSATNAEEFLKAGARTIAVSAAFTNPDQLAHIRTLLQPKVSA